MSRSTTTDPFAIPDDPELDDLFRVWARNIILSVRTMSVGSVTTFNPTTQTASVTLDILEVARAAGSPVPIVRPPLVLPKVPVFIYGDGLGINYVSVPVVPGTTGMLIVSDRSLSKWIERPGPVPVDPVEWFTHRFASAVFVPGLSDALHRISPPISLDGPVIEGPIIRLGRTAEQSAVIAELLITAIDAVMASLVSAGAGNAYAGAGAAQGVWDGIKETIKSQRVKLV